MLEKILEFLEHLKTVAIGTLFQEKQEFSKSLGFIFTNAEDLRIGVFLTQRWNLDSLSLQKTLGLQV